MKKTKNFGPKTMPDDTVDDIMMRVRFKREVYAKIVTDGVLYRGAKRFWRFAYNQERWVTRTVSESTGLKSPRICTLYLVTRYVNPKFTDVVRGIPENAFEIIEALRSVQ